MHRSSKEALTYFVSAWSEAICPLPWLWEADGNWVLQQRSVGGLLTGARCQVDNTEALYLHLMNASNVTSVSAGS